MHHIKMFLGFTIEKGTPLVHPLHHVNDVNSYAQQSLVYE